MTLSLGLEGLLAILLLVTVFYCWRLDGRLNALRQGQNGMREAIMELIQATQKAEACIEGLRATAGQSGAELDASIHSAQKLAADLQRLGRNANDHARPMASNVSPSPRGGGLLDRLREAG